MVETLKIEAQKRDLAGKGTARAARRSGQVPAVIYGGKQDPQMITVEKKFIDMHLHSKAFKHHIVVINLDGKEYKALTKDVQYHPVNDNPLHIDFFRVTDSTEVVVHIPVEFKNHEESPGLKRGGVLNIVRHTVDLKCKASLIPEEIIADLTGLNVGDSVHISSFKLPEGVKPVIDDRDFTIATIVAPSSLKSEAEEAAEAEEGAEGEEAAEGDKAEGDKE